MDSVIPSLQPNVRVDDVARLQLARHRLVQSMYGTMRLLACYGNIARVLDSPLLGSNLSDRLGRTETAGLPRCKGMGIRSSFW